VLRQWRRGDKPRFAGDGDVDARDAGSPGESGSDEFGSGWRSGFVAEMW
jgi:hypothetical protein